MLSVKDDFPVYFSSLIVYNNRKETKEFRTGVRPAYFWFSSVSDIKEKNEVPFSSVRAAEDGGYEPCKKCNPDN